MLTFCTRNRLTWAGVDAIDDHVTALAFLSAITDRSLRSTFAVLLDEHRRGMSIFRVNEASRAGGPIPHNDDVLLAADRVVAQASEHPGFCSVIMASVRPGGRDELDDLDRWGELDGRFAVAGFDLVEWFVLANSVSTPRSLVGEPPRWRH